ncbi:MAG: CsgG/HfaB family protein [Candidatus Omnitrophica bacterium]|nr:CsgG/HfaB family protein [Candidatus Omnitrophota bacterium]
MSNARLQKLVITCLALSIALFAGTASAKVASPKKTVAVADFENKSGFSGEWNMGQGMADMLTDSLMQSGQFAVLERQALDAVLAEQNLAASGRAATQGGAKMGDIKRAQILIQGAVTEFQECTSGGGQGINVYGLSLGSNSSEAHVAVIIRLIDSTTSQVLASQRVEGKAAAGGVTVGAGYGGVGFNTSGFKKTPVGKACQIAIDNAVQFISQEAAKLSWRGRIIKVDDNGTVYLNTGSQGGVQSGMIFAIVRPGEQLVDPETGMNLGGEEKSVGTLKVNDVQEKFSKGTFTGEKPQAGDVVKETA